MSSHTATILVTDLVGSTAIRVRLGEEQAEVLRREHDRLLRVAVEAEGGVVVKGLGDGVLASFAGASDAVAAGVGIQQAVHQFNASQAEASLAVRVGISGGDIEVEPDGDCFGTPVVEAARLCAAAAEAQILVAEVVKVMARGRGGHEFAPIGPLLLKGLPDPIPAFEVRWTPRQVGASGPTAEIPLPGGLQTPWFSYAGRLAERECLESVYKLASAGERRVVLISGEPGIGKTRLVAHLAHHVQEDRALVLYGRCEEELDVAYRPMTEALRHLLAHIPEVVMAEHLAGCGGELGRLVPLVGAPPPERSDPETERLRLFEAVGDLLRRAARWTPVVLVMDDLHWANRSTLMLLRHLVRADPKMRVMIVGTYRDTDLARSHPLADLLADLRREEGTERLALGGLDEAETTAFILARAGAPTEEPERVSILARLLLEETDGNPFFMGEVLAHLVDAGALFQRDGRWQGDTDLIARIGIPEGVREVIGRRLSALGPETNEVLTVAAVIGSTFGADVVAEVLSRAVGEVAALLDEPLRRRLLVEVTHSFETFAFAHALVRQTLLEELSTSRRVRLHHRVAEVLEARGAPAAELAYHFCESAAMADAAKAVDYAMTAAAEARASLAFEQALNLYRRALEAEESLAPDPARRGVILLEIGTARDNLGEALEARADFVAAADCARRAGRTDLLVEAACRYGGRAAVWLEWGDPVGPALAEEALEAVGDGDSEERVRLLAKLSFWAVLDQEVDGRLALTQEAMELSARLGSTQARAEALTYRMWAVRGTGRLAEQLSLADELEALALSTDDPGRHMVALINRAGAQFIRNDLAACKHTIAQMAELGERRREVYARWSTAAYASHFAQLEGRFSDLEVCMAVEAEAAPAVGDVGRALGALRRLFCEELRGTDAGCAAALRALEVEFPMLRKGNSYSARAAWAEGDLASATRAIAEYRSTWRTGLAEGRIFTVSGTAPVVCAVGAVELAAEMYDFALPYAGQWATQGGEQDNGLTDEALGRFAACLGRRDEAVARFRSALNGYRAAGSPVYRARTLAALAPLLEGDAAADSAGEAADICARLGLARLGREVAALGIV